MGLLRKVYIEDKKTSIRDYAGTRFFDSEWWGCSVLMKGGCYKEVDWTYCLR